LENKDEKKDDKMDVDKPKESSKFTQYGEIDEIFHTQASELVDDVANEGVLHPAMFEWLFKSGLGSDFLKDYEENFEQEEVTQAEANVFAYYWIRLRNFSKLYKQQGISKKFEGSVFIDDTGESYIDYDSLDEKNKLVFSILKDYKDDDHGLSNEILAEMDFLKNYMFTLGRGNYGIASLVSRNMERLANELKTLPPAPKLDAVIAKVTPSAISQVFDDDDVKVVVGEAAKNVKMDEKEFDDLKVKLEASINERETQYTTLAEQVKANTELQAVVKSLIDDLAGIKIEMQSMKDKEKLFLLKDDFVDFDVKSDKELGKVKEYYEILNKAAVAKAENELEKIKTELLNKIQQESKAVEVDYTTLTKTGLETYKEATTKWVSDGMEAFIKKHNEWQQEIMGKVTKLEEGAKEFEEKFTPTFKGVEKDVISIHNVFNEFNRAYEKWKQDEVDKNLKQLLTNRDELYNAVAALQAKTKTIDGHIANFKTWSDKTERRLGDNEKAVEARATQQQMDNLYMELKTMNDGIAANARTTLGLIRDETTTSANIRLIRANIITDLLTVTTNSPLDVFVQRFNKADVGSWNSKSSSLQLLGTQIAQIADEESVDILEKVGDIVKVRSGIMIEKVNVDERASKINDNVESGLIATLEGQASLYLNDFLNQAKKLDDLYSQVIAVGDQQVGISSKEILKSFIGMMGGGNNRFSQLLYKKFLFEVAEAQHMHSRAAVAHQELVSIQAESIDQIKFEIVQIMNSLSPSALTPVMNYNVNVPEISNMVGVIALWDQVKMIENKSKLEVATASVTGLTKQAVLWADSQGIDEKEGVAQITKEFFKLLDQMDKVNDTSASMFFTDRGVFAPTWLPTKVEIDTSDLFRPRSQQGPILALPSPPLD